MRKGLLVALAVAAAGVLIFSCLLLAVTSMLHPHWWALRWQLPDGTVVRLYKMPHDPPGRDTIKCLEITTPGGRTKTHQFARWHAGYRLVQLRVSEDGCLVWLVDWEARQVGCVLDLRTGQFWDELDAHPPGIRADSGQVVLPTR